MAQMTIDGWAVIEQIGGARFAGKVSECALQDVPMIRVDVPKVDGIDSFTRYLSPVAVAAFTRCGEASAKAYAEEFRSRPVPNAFTEMVIDPPIDRPAPETVVEDLRGKLTACFGPPSIVRDYDGHRPLEEESNQVRPTIPTSRDEGETLQDPG